MATFLYKGLYMFKAIICFVSSHILCSPPHNINTAFLLLFQCLLLLYLLWLQLLFLDLQTLKLQKTQAYLSNVQPLAWLSLLIVILHSFFFSDISCMSITYKAVNFFPFSMDIILCQATLANPLHNMSKRCRINGQYLFLFSC